MLISPNREQFVRGAVRKPSEKWSSWDLDGRSQRDKWHGLLCGMRNRIRIAFDANACVFRSPIIMRRGTVDIVLKRSH